MREDSEVVLQAVSQHGLALQFAEAAGVPDVRMAGGCWENMGKNTWKTWETREHMAKQWKMWEKHLEHVGKLGKLLENRGKTIGTYIENV